MTPIHPSVFGRLPMSVLDRAFLLGVVLLLTACGTQHYAAQTLATQPFLDRAIVQEQGDVTVSVAVPGQAETIHLTGLDLYDQGIQPVWFRIENRSADALRFVPWSIDRDYFSPLEVAYMNRRGFSANGYATMERWFLDSGMSRRIAPGEVREGLVYTHLMPGTKGFNLNLLTPETALDFTFFVPLPGFTPDFAEVNFAELYRPEEIHTVDAEGLKRVLESELPCCATNPAGDRAGGIFNTVLVGQAETLRRALLRGGWIETERDAEPLDEIARQQSYRGRQPDGIYTMSRQEGNEQLKLHLWLSPWRVEGKPVWIGQTYYASNVIDLVQRFRRYLPEGSRLSAFFASESISADVDSAQRFLLQNLWYSGGLERVGYVQGMAPATLDSPALSFGGASYFTDGRRMVAFLSHEPRALDELRFAYDTRATDLVREASGAANDKQVPPPNARIHSQQEGPLTIATAVPTAEETEAIFGVDLYERNIQPVWVQVENRSDSLMYLSPMGLDAAYFTAREAAHRSISRPQPGFARSFEERGHVTLSMAPRSIRSGYIFSRVDEGTKSFNIDVVGEDKAFQMSFFVPVPGLKLDHYDVDIHALYPAEEYRDVSRQELIAELEAMPCCVVDKGGDDQGDPLNLVFIGDLKSMYYAFMRAGWDETETIYSGSLWKTGLSALTGGRYRYSPVSALYVFQRAQDVALQKARDSIHERNHLRLWITPLRFEGKPVWVGQISRDIGVRFTRRTITTHKIDPDVDEAREYLLEDLAYAQALEGFGYVGGVGAASYDEPRGNLTGDPYFTDGRRAVMWIASEPVGLDEVTIFDFSQ